MITQAAAAIEVDDLHKAYGRGHERRQALSGVSFELRRGQRLAYLGPNGAGKTTMIRCLSGRTRPDGGSIRIMGEKSTLQRTREILGLVPQEIALYEDLTPRENLIAFARFHGLRGRVARRQTDWALQWTGLTDRADELVGGFSGGMKRRVNLACGVLHQPAVLLLDEPTVGVDPQSRARIFEMLDELRSNGTSILLTTHHLDEAQSQCEHIVIVDQGRVVAQGSFDDLVHQTVGGDRMVQVHLEQPIRKDGNDGLAGTGLALQVTPGERMVSARMSGLGKSLPDLLTAVQACGYGVRDVEVETPTLHHVFLHLTGHELRDS